MEFEHLRYFVTVAQTEHMSIAADVLHISQPALSGIIRRLETELGTNLFDRRGRSIQLNQYGRMFLENVRPVIAQMDSAVQALNEAKYADANRVTIIAPPLYSFPDLMGAIYSVCPNVTIRNMDFSFSKISHALTERQADFCILGRALSSPKLNCIPLTSDELVMLLPEKHPLAGRETARLIEFANDQFADYPDSSATQSDRDVFCRLAGFTSRVACEGNSMYELIEAVKQGSYVALIPYRILYRYRTEGTSIVHITDPICRSQLHMYWDGTTPERPIVTSARNAVINYFLSAKP